MSQNKALRDKNGKPVFVNKYGEYCETFPENAIVDRNTKKSGFTVYFFVSKGYNDYDELSYHLYDKQKALEFATKIYGKTVNISDIIKGEIFEVEIHNN